MRYWDLAWEAVNRHHGMQRIGEFAAVLDDVATSPYRTLAEIGVGGGGSLWAWTQIVDEVYAITEPVPNPAAVETYGAAVLWSDSHDPAAYLWLTATLAGRPLDVLFIDGDHSYDGARADFETYGPLVRPGGLILLHDVIDAPGVAKLWDEIHGADPAGTHLIADPADPLGFGVITVSRREA